MEWAACMHRMGVTAWSELGSSAAAEAVRRLGAGRHIPRRSWRSESSYQSPPVLRLLIVTLNSIPPVPSNPIHIPLANSQR